MRHADCIVIGAGVVGCAVAYALARAGASVSVVDRDGIGEHASRAAAGMLAPLTESGGAGPLARFGLISLDRFPTLVEELRELSLIDPHYAPTGVLRVAFPGEAEALQERARRLAPHGCSWVTRGELLKREPRLDPSVAGALWSPREGHVDSLLLTRAYAGAAARRGARFELGVAATRLLRDGGRVTGIETTSGRLAARDVVLCTGAWTRLVESWVDVPLPVEPVRGQMVGLDMPEPALAHILWGPDAYLVPRADGTLAVGATIEHVGFDLRNTAEGVAAMLRGATALVPVLAQARFRRAWAGLRPGTPDGLPLLGAVPGADGLLVASGHYRSGVLLSAATALAVADWIVEGKRWPELEPFDPARFRPPET